MSRLYRSPWAKVVVLAVVGVLTVTSLAFAGSGFPLLPDAPDRPHTPGQRWGTAAGRDHLVGTPNANRDVPASLRARYPLAKDAMPQPGKGHDAAHVGTAPAVKVTGYDKRSSTELTDRRDATSTTWANADGTSTTVVSPVPVNYRDGNGDWQPIDSSLDADAGGWRNTADATGVRLSADAAADELARVTLADGSSVGYRLSGARHVRGTAEGSVVQYPGVLPGTDLRLESHAGGVKESLLLRDADAPGSFRFPLDLHGLHARLADDGSVRLADEQGTTRAVIPRGSMEDARHAASDAVAYELLDGGRTLQITPDAGWLADPDRAFPVAVDPSVDTTAATAGMTVTGSGTTGGGSELSTGKGPNGSSAAYLGFPGLDDKLKNHKIFGAQLQLTEFDSPSCKARPVSVHGVTQSWSANDGATYPGPSVGPSLASKSFAYGYIATGQSKSACPAASELFDLGKGGRDLVQRWANGSQPDYGLSVRASATDALGWKKFAGYSTANPPKLFVTHSPYDATYSFPSPVPNPPVLQNQNGKVKVTVTNKGAETWTPSTYYLAYRVYDSKGKLVTQQRAANLGGNVARGAKTTLDATIKALKPGSYLLDFTMVRTGGKVFTDEQVPPGRLVLEVFDIAPVVQAQYPPNGYQAQTLSPQLWASAVDIDAPAGQTLQYKFEICAQGSDGKPTACTTSAYQSSSAYTVPAGRLSWGTTYLWRGFVKDASNEVPTDQVALLTSVPQPEITSHLSGAGQDKEFDPNTGNYTTTATDASLGGVGPDTTLVRTYNSLDPRRDAAFGAGWSTRYDMKLTPDGDGTGNVRIRYPDGQDVRFGRNPDGSYVPPAGRFAKLTTDATTGSWKLQDKSGTTYDFSSGGLLSKVTDATSNTQTYTYSGGKLSKVVNDRTGRSLTFTWTGAHVTTVSTNPVGGAALTWTYTYDGDVLKTVCAPGSTACTAYDYGSGSHYRSVVLDSRPESYWRLGDDDGTAANSEIAVNLGKDRGTYTDVTLGATGAVPGDGSTAATFNGTTSVVKLPGGALKESRDAAVEIWFKTPATGLGGPLFGYQDKAWGTTPTTGVPALYVGTDGKLRGQFWTGSIAPITVTSTNVNDGKWHHAVLSVAGADQSLYLDGKLAGTLTGKQLTATALTYDQIGAAAASTPGSWPGWGSTSAKSFAGTLAEAAVYHHPLGAGTVAAHYAEGARAADELTAITMPSGRTGAEISYDTKHDRVAEYTDEDGGTWKVGAPAVFGDADDLRRTVEVDDPADQPYFYEYDGLTSRLLRYGEPLGIGKRDSDQPTPSPTQSDPGQVCSSPDPGDPQFCTDPPPGGDGDTPIFVGHPVEGVAIRSFHYDDQGYQTGVTDENGDTVTMAYDDRGNVTRRTTCRAKDDCQTTYTTYPATTSDFDLRGDLPTETRDGRSSGPTDNRYRTQYTYNTGGQLVDQIAPDNGKVHNTYTTGAEPAVDTGNTPTGLPLTSQDPLGAVTKYAYFHNGDLARVTEASGLVTSYTYDEIGRKLSEKEVSDSQPAGITTTYTYDKQSRLTSTTEPPTTNAVTSARHQQRTVTDYDPDGKIVRTEVSDLLGGDPSRVMTFDLDDHGRVRLATDAAGNETSYGYDDFGNQTSLEDADGNKFEYAYTARNKIAEVRLRDWQDDGGDPDYTVLNSYAYDMAGRLAQQTDAMGRTMEYGYYGDGLVKSATLKNFHNPDGTTRDFVVEQDEYDGAGNVVRETGNNGADVAETSYDAVGRVASEVEDPGGLARRTTYTYDLGGNVKTAATSGNPSNVPWPTSVTPEKVSYTYDTVGNLWQEITSDGTHNLTTTYTYDQRGLTRTVTDPANNRTTYGYDEAGRPVSTTYPAVATESNGGAPQTKQPMTFAGYDTFGAVTDSQDALGQVTHVDYDLLGRAVTTTAPSYTVPGTGQVLTPATHTAYDGVGNVTESTDALGKTTTYTYDRQNNLVHKEEPTGTGDDHAGWDYTYTRTGEILSVTGPTGSRAETTYDDLDRPVTATQIERKPVPGAFTTRYEYDDGGNMVKQTDPGGGLTQVAYDGLDQPVRVTDPAGDITQTGYDFTGRTVRQSDGLGRTSSQTYNQLGQMVQESDLDQNNSPLRTVGYGYDKQGNLTSSTDPYQHTTTYGYDALGRQTSQTEPVSDTKSISTSWGYDANGNQTRYTDGRGNVTVSTYNTLGLPESVIDPATDKHPAAADRTFTTAYDAVGQPVTQTEPGGVTRTRTFDNAGLLTKETGTGAETATQDHTYGYDKAGHLTTSGTPKGDDSYTYDDRGLLLKAEGPSGTATYDYDSDGLLTSRTDATGTANFGYSRQQLKTATDSLTQSTQTYTYDASGAVKQVDYGAGQSRTYGYDALGRIDTDTLKNSSGTALSSVDYGFDDNDNMTSKTTTGTAKAGANSYGYDYAGRLTSWTADGSQTGYTWDDSGNRTQNGTKTATYDQRNERLSDGDYTYDYTARGTMASRTSSGLREDFSFDAFDRMTQAGESGTSYTYDSQDRIASRGDADFTYDGLSPDPVKDASASYGRGPMDELMSVQEGADAQLTVQDAHGDVTGAFDAADGSRGTLSESTAYDPFGEVTGTSGSMPGDVGYQGDWTDPSTDQVDMGARWYDPSGGTFDSRDSLDYSGGASILANRYTYGNGDPLDTVDPDGHFGCGIFSGACHKVASAAKKGAHYVAKGASYVAKGASYVWGGIRSGASWLYNSVIAPAWHFAVSAVKAIGSGLKWVYKQGKKALQRGVQAVKNAVTWVAQKTGAADAARWAKEKAEAAKRAAIARAKAITKKAKQAVAWAVQHNPIPDIVAAAKPLMTAVKTVVSVAAKLPAAVVSVTRDVVADTAKVVSTVRDVAVQAAGVVVEDVSNAVQAATDFARAAAPVVWDAVKVGAQLAYEVSGLSDITSCVTTGDAESCVWAAATVAGLLAGGAGAVAARSAKAGRMAVEAEKLANGARKVQHAAEDVGDAVDCVNTVTALASANSFAAGTKVLMADGSTKPIEDVRPGDRVKATDPTTGKSAGDEVTDTITGRGTKQMVELTVDTDGPKGHATGTLTATKGHPFWSPNLHKWLQAGQLKPGQWLRTSTGAWVQITATRAWTQSATVFNLTVDRAHTFFVAVGAASALVHNEDRQHALECPLRAYTDLTRMGPGRNEGATSVLWTPSGNRYFDFSRNRSAAEIQDLPISLRRVVLQTGHHGGCAEIGCIAQAMRAGDLVRGSTSLAMTHRPLDNARNRQLLPGCGACQQVMSRLQITDTY
ncbi:polymorphic toxin-type HINT domain-containing protein [Actinacidiphila alni]|uniref:polymorphic toxin-type HINT domain-containing protein n=1 Tax=Actinacidiphila alni TaxID=380248 RepID=UPI0034573388